MLVKVVELFKFISCANQLWPLFKDKRTINIIILIQFFLALPHFVKGKYCFCIYLFNIQIFK